MVQRDSVWAFKIPAHFYWMGRSAWEASPTCITLQGFFFSISYIFMCATKRYAFSTKLFWSELNNVSCFLKPEFGIRCLFFILGLSRTADYRDLALAEAVIPSEIRQQRTSELYLCVVWTSAFKGLGFEKSHIFLWNWMGWGEGRKIVSTPPLTNFPGVTPRCCSFIMSKFISNYCNTTYSKK